MDDSWKGVSLEWRAILEVKLMSAVSAVSSQSATQETVSDKSSADCNHEFRTHKKSQ